MKHGRLHVVHTSSGNSWICKLRWAAYGRWGGVYFLFSLPLVGRTSYWMLAFTTKDFKIPNKWVPVEQSEPFWKKSLIQSFKPPSTCLQCIYQEYFFFFLMQYQLGTFILGAINFCTTALVWSVEVKTGERLSSQSYKTQQHQSLSSNPHTDTTLRLCKKKKNSWTYAPPTH